MKRGYRPPGHGQIRQVNSIVAEGDCVIVHGRFSGRGSSVNGIAADILPIETGVLQEHWDVIQDEACEEQSKAKSRCSDEFPEIDMNNRAAQADVVEAMSVVQR